MAITYEKMKTYTVPDGNDKVQYEIVDDAGRKMIAPDWDVSYDEAFAVGDYVANDGKLYRFTSPHTAGDVWDDEEVTEITVTDEIKAVKSDVSGKASKVSGATNGNLAGLDGNGDLTDSGISATELKSQIDGKASIIRDTVSNVPIASVPDGAANLPLTALRFAVEPIQAGSGDPYPAGGGKNKFNANNEAEKAQQYCNFSNGIFTIKQVPAENDSFVIGTIDLVGGESYILNGGYGNPFRCFVKVDNTNYVSKGSDSPTFTPSENMTVNVTAVIQSDATIGLQIKPMIRLSTVADSTFAPYSNIRPITGRTGAVVSQSGADTSDPTTHTVQFGSTVFGGQIDWVRGKAVCGRVSETFTSCLSVAKSNATGYYYTVLKNSGVKKDNGMLLCNIAKNDGSSNANFGNVYVTSAGYLVIVLTDQTLTTKALVDAWLGENILQIVYGMPEPIEYDLSDLDEIRTVLGGGTMNLWSDSGDIELMEYPCDTKLYVDKKIAETVALILEN